MSEQIHTRAAWWALVLLTATYTFSFIDRQIINLLVDLRTSSQRKGGLRVALRHSDIPLGRIVDRAYSCS